MSPSTFVVGIGPHGHMQLATERNDLNLQECLVIRLVMSNSLVSSEDYQKRSPAHPFLQGYQEPTMGLNDGWVLIEFWTDNKPAIDEFVTYLNQKVASMAKVPPKETEVDSEGYYPCGCHHSGNWVNPECRIHNDLSR